MQIPSQRLMQWERRKKFVFLTKHFWGFAEMLSAMKCKNRTVAQQMFVWNLQLLLSRILQRATCKYSRTPNIKIDFIYFWFCDVKLHLKTNPRCSFRSIHARSCKHFILSRQRDIKFSQTLTFRETLRVIPSNGARNRPIRSDTLCNPAASKAVFWSNIEEDAINLRPRFLYPSL